MKPPPLSSQQKLHRVFQAAAEAMNRLDYQECIDTLERANRLHPGNPTILLELGRVHGMRYNYAAAERCFENAVRVTPRRTDSLAMAGLHSRGFGRYEMARSYFERAIKQPGASPDSCVKLAELYERFRMLEEAADLIDHALKMDPRCALALLVQARLERLRGSTETAEKIVRPLLTMTDADSWSTRIRGWYELGAILDKQGRFDEAMTAFLEAKSMIRPNAQRFVPMQELVHTRLREVAAAIKLKAPKWMADPATPAPQHRVALLCGHPRSGTTLLEQVLDSHPEIISAEETPIFVSEVSLPLRRGFPVDAGMLEVLEAATLDKLTQVRTDYARAMELYLGTSLDGRLLIDKNPSLTTLALVAVRAFPEMKILTALRDPRDVVMSCFMQPLPLNQVSAMFLSLEGTVREYESVMGFWRAVALALGHSCIELRYEDMVADLEAVSRRALAFLGVTWDPRVLRYDEHARQKLVRSPTYAEVAKPITRGAIGRWRNYQKYLEAYLEKLAPFAKAFGYE